ncbi:MAG: FIST signal transduction protein [Polyangiales bacterium]
MQTKVGTGYSDARDASEAAATATRSAIDELGDRRPDLVLVFASVGYDHGRLVSTVRGLTGSAPLLGCTTAGQFTATEVGRGSVVVTTVSSESMRFHTTVGRGVREHQAEAVQRALAPWSQWRDEAREAGLSHDTCFVCTDGLAGRGEQLVSTIHEATGGQAQIVGGAAADDERFEETLVFVGDDVLSDAIGIVCAFSRAPVGLGVRHGLNAACDSMLVTEAEGSILKTINGRPALEAYEKFAADLGLRLEPDNREPFMMTHELGMLTPTGEFKIRAPLRTRDDGSLVMASEVPAGAAVTIMQGTKEGLVVAAELAARSALANLGGGRPAGVLVFDCICRHAFLKDEYPRQVEAFRSVVGDGVPIAGWETYGEIAMTPSQQTGWHNSTTVLAVLPR